MWATPPPDTVALHQDVAKVRTHGEWVRTLAFVCCRSAREQSHDVEQGNGHGSDEGHASATPDAHQAEGNAGGEQPPRPGRGGTDRPDRGHHGAGEQDGWRGQAHPPGSHRCGSPFTPVAMSSPRSGSALSRWAPTPSSAPARSIHAGGQAGVGRASATMAGTTPKATAYGTADQIVRLNARL